MILSRLTKHIRDQNWFAAVYGESRKSIIAPLLDNFLTEKKP